MKSTFKVPESTAEAYRDMIAREQIKLARQVAHFKNLATSPKETLRKMKEEFPSHQALEGLLESVIKKAYDC